MQNQCKYLDRTLSHIRCGLDIYVFKSRRMPRSTCLLLVRDGGETTSKVKVGINLWVEKGNLVDLVKVELGGS